jgi:putative peptidoglycan lipid II flippase
MAMAVYYACRLADWSLTGHKMIKGAVLGGAIVSGVIIYALCARLVRSEEMMEAMAMIKRKFGR